MFWSQTVKTKVKVGQMYSDVFRWKNIFWIFETASEVLAGGSGANSVSGVGDDTAPILEKGRKEGL